MITIATGTSATHSSNYDFTDMSMSPDGRYVFSADYGGENIGYCTPLNQSYVHRFDLNDGSWSIENAVIAGDIQAASDSTFVLKSIDQWVTFTYNAWSGDAGVTQLNTNSNSAFPGYYASVYEGNFRYDYRTARLLHGNSGLSSQQIQAFKIVSDQFVMQEGTGVYGSASGYGPNVALATDGSVFYYGALAVDALDVTHTLHAYPETIYTATGDIAFGNGDFYDAHTATMLGSFPVTATVYGLNQGGTDLWLYDASANMLRHFIAVIPDGGVDAETADASEPDDASTATEDDGPADAADAGAFQDSSLDGTDVAMFDAAASDALSADVGSPAQADDEAGADGAAYDATTDGSAPVDATLAEDSGVAIVPSDAGEYDATSMSPETGPIVASDGPGPSAASEHAGCGCSVPGTGATGPRPAGLAALGLFGLVRRRRARVRRQSRF